MFHLRRLFDDVKLISETTTRPGDDDTKATPASAKKSSQKSGGGVEEAARVLDAVDVRRASEGLVSVEWESNPVNDLVADSIVCVMMQVRFRQRLGGRRGVAASCRGDGRSRRIEMR
jgi:hypothetical protein